MRLTWSNAGQRFYEVGVDRGVLYVDDDPGVAWSSLVSVEESPSGGEAKSYYLDGVKYLNLSEREEFEGSISAFYSPAEFDVCDGIRSVRPGLSATQQRRKAFHLTYRTRIGNDVDGETHGYKIHILFNARVQPTQHTYSSIGENVDPDALSWSISSKPIWIPGIGYSSHLIVDSTVATPYSVQTLEDILYGDESHFPRMPTVEDILDIFDDTTDPLIVTDLGDGVFSIFGSSSAVHFIEGDTWEVVGDTVVLVGADGATITSE